MEITEEKGKEEDETILIYVTKEVEENLKEGTTFVDEPEESDKEGGANLVSKTKALQIEDNTDYVFETGGSEKEEKAGSVYDTEEIEENNKTEEHNNILLFKISETEHPMSVHVLHTICWPFGRVLRIVIFWKGEKTRALVEFDKSEAAKLAADGLDGRDIYPGCCSIEVGFSNATRLKVSKNYCYSWDYTKPKVAPLLQLRSCKRFPLLEDPLFLPYRPEKDLAHRPALLSEPFPPQRYSINLVFEDFWY